MRITLEQLRAMSDEQLIELWNLDRFPFEKASCGACLTYHANHPKLCRASNEQQHKEISDAVLDLGAAHFAGRATWLKENLESLYGLRLKYDHLYLPPEPDNALAAREISTELVEKAATQDAGVEVK